MELKIVNRIEDVAQSEWNSVVRASDDTIFQSHQWLRAYEDGHPESDPYHILVYDDSELVAACPTFLEECDPRLDEYGDLSKVLLSHSFQAWYSNILGRPDDEMITAIVLDTVEEIAADCGVETVGFNAVPEDETGFRETLKSTGYTVAQHNCSMVLDVPSSMDEYMQSLDGDHRRDFRRRVRRSKKRGVTVEVVDDVDFDLFRDLCYEVFDRHDDYEKRYSSEFLEAARTHLDDEISYFVARSPNDEIFSAFLVLESGDSLYPWIAGINYDYQKVYEPSLLFYHAVVEHAIEQDFSKIDVGRGVIEFKQKFGYEPFFTYVALKGPKATEQLEEALPEAEIHDGQEVRSCC